MPDRADGIRVMAYYSAMSNNEMHFFVVRLVCNDLLHWFCNMEIYTRTVNKEMITPQIHSITLNKYRLQFHC